MDIVDWSNCYRSSRERGAKLCEGCKTVESVASIGPILTMRNGDSRSSRFARSKKAERRFAPRRLTCMMHGPAVVPSQDWGRPLIPTTPLAEEHTEAIYTSFFDIVAGFALSERPSMFSLEMRRSIILQWRSRPTASACPLHIRKTKRRGHRSSLGAAQYDPAVDWA